VLPVRQLWLDQLHWCLSRVLSREFAQGLLVKYDILDSLFRAIHDVLWRPVLWEDFRQLRTSRALGRGHCSARPGLDDDFAVNEILPDPPRAGSVLRAWRERCILCSHEFDRHVVLQETSNSFWHHSVWVIVGWSDLSNYGLQAHSKNRVPMDDEICRIPDLGHVRHCQPDSEVKIDPSTEEG
jgi:hypothetical protein